MTKWSYTKGLHDIGNGAWAYLLPDGSWGWSNAGLIVDSGQSLLVDTLFDERLTGEMLSTMKNATGIGGREITTLVNTHANGDHTFGNRLVEQAEIIASKASAEEMDEMPPQMMAEMIRQAPQLGEAGKFLQEIMAPFHFDGIELVAPTRTFSDRLDLKIGNKEVQLLEVGPAHTKGDTLVYVPSDRVIYTGDILFIGGTPIIWAGPVKNWIKACDLIVDLDVDVIVPGHGPITDKNGVRQVRAYLDYIDRETRKRFDAGMPFDEAAKDIALAEFGAWSDSERIVVNVHSLYKEYSGSDEESDVVGLFGMMADYRAHHSCRHAP